MTSDAQFMARALELAEMGKPSPNPRVGAVIVKDGKIIGEYRSMGLRPYTLEKAKMFGFDQPYLEACL